MSGMSRCSNCRYIIDCTDAASVQDGSGSLFCSSECMWTWIFSGERGHRKAPQAASGAAVRESALTDSKAPEEPPTPPRQVLRRPAFLYYPTWEEVLAARRSPSSRSSKSSSESSESSGNAMFETHTDFGFDLARESNAANYAPEQSSGSRRTPNTSP